MLRQEAQGKSGQKKSVKLEQGRSPISRNVKEEAVSLRTVRLPIFLQIPW
jgi:hypothetical protein